VQIRIRSSNLEVLGQCPLKFSQQCFSYAAPGTWSTLPPSLQQFTNNDTFKLQLKTGLFERAFFLDYCPVFTFYFILFSERRFIFSLLLFTTVNHWSPTDSAYDMATCISGTQREDEVTSQHPQHTLLFIKCHDQ